MKLLAKKRVPVVLLVENSPDDVELTRVAFASCDIRHELVVVWDGAEALEYLFAEGRYAGRDDNRWPCLVLLDMSMPKVDGIDVLKALRARTEQRVTPVVMLTSSRQQGDVARSYIHGANSYIQKPVVFSEFMAAIVLVAQYWLRLNVVTDS